MSNRVKPRTAVPQVERVEPRRLLSDVVPVGPEFRVNTYTTGSQRGPSIAADADGDFVVTWGSIGLDGSSEGVIGQRFSSMGVPQGAEFRVNSYTTGGQGFPSVAADADGDFVVAWGSIDQDGSNFGVYAQRYNAAGVQQGGEFRVNTYTPGYQSGRDNVAVDADGDFVIAWSSDSQDGSSFGVYAQRYNSVGVPQGSEFRVNTHTTGNQSGGSVAMDAEGNFVVVWGSYSGQDGSGSGVYAQRYDREGIAQGAEFRVNTFTTSQQDGAAIAVGADGEFVIAWHSRFQDGSEYGIYAQRYNSAGTPQGDEFRVNTVTTSHQSVPGVAMDVDGDFVIAWNGYHQGAEVYAQRYDSAGVPQDPEFQVNSYTTSFQLGPKVAVDADGDFVVAWQSSFQDGSDYGVYAQRFGVVPEVTASALHFASAPHQLSFSFDRDVSASLGTDDLIVQNLSTGQTVPSSAFALAYDTATNAATFTYTGTTAGIIGMLPDGRYTATLVAAGVTTIQGAPLAADAVLNFRFLQGDANNDGRVNLEDFNILAGNFGQSPRDFTQGDFDYSGNVNLNDFNILASRFGQVLAAPALGGGSIFTGFRRSDTGDEPLEELASRGTRR